MRIVWSDLAKAQLYELYQYYEEIANVKVAKSIKSKIFQKTKKLTRHPLIGQEEFNPIIAPLKYRYLVSGNVKIIYKVLEHSKVILIAALFDTRQNPNDLKIGLYE